MAAYSGPSAVTAEHEVPEWVEKNRQLFKIPPPGYDAKTRSKALNLDMVRAVVASMFAANGDLDAGTGGAEVSNDGLGGIDIPTGGQPASYFRDVKNHANILTTFIVTARRASGFIPAITNNNMTEAQATDYVRKFNGWLAELDSYVGYVHLVSEAVQETANETTNCNIILAGISDFVNGLMGLTGPLAESLGEKISSLIRSAANFVVEKGSARNAAFQMETTDTSGEANPIQPVSFSSTVMSRSQNGKSFSESTKVTLAAFTFQLNSSAVIANAVALSQGSTVSGAKQYRDYVNAPIREWEQTARRHHHHPAQHA